MCLYIYMCVCVCVYLALDYTDECIARLKEMRMMDSEPGLRSQLAQARLRYRLNGPSAAKQVIYHIISGLLELSYQGY